VNLRFRFILSNVLPLFIVLPLMGLLSIYIFERKILIPRQSSEIEADLDLLTHLITEEPDSFGSESTGRRFVQRYSAGAHWRLMILNPEGVLVATNSHDDLARVGMAVGRSEIADTISEGRLNTTSFSQSMQTEVIDIWAAVRDSSDTLLGILRISQPLETLGEEIMRVRGFMVAIIAVGLLIGALIGLGLALSMENPLQQMTLSLQTMAREEHPSPIEVEGPEEFITLASAFNHLIERIDEMEVTRRKLLANLVHELGRPLGALRSALHALMSGADQDLELKNELLVGMDTQTSDLARLVDDLTHLYDEDAGRFKLEYKEVNIQTWLGETVAPWRAHAEEKSIRLLLDVQKDVVLNIDPNRMSQALGNLLSNAIKFTPIEGEITVRTFVEDSQVVIDVQDSGPGLSTEDRENLFTPFYRGKQSTRFPRGMGLGLSIARDIVQSHGGRLVAKPSTGAGTLFSIYLPQQSSAMEIT
jgi:signal transduction histidine kinase